MAGDISEGFLSDAKNRVLQSWRDELFGHSRMSETDADLRPRLISFKMPLQSRQQTQVVQDMGPQIQSHSSDLFEKFIQCRRRFVEGARKLDRQ